MSNAIPLPEPDCRLPMDGPPRWRADQMHAHAAAVTAAKDAEIAALRAEVAGLQEALATESSRNCATEHDCIYQPSCGRIGKCMRPERPFNCAARKGTT